MTGDDFQINADMTRRVVVDAAAAEWEPSPAAGVWRKRLHLTGPEETGRVTSIVRYDAGSAFPAHDHPDGEEILVLAGVFSDETGDYPAGSYILNPEGFRHAPASEPGCTLFVKLRQYAGADRPQLRIDTASGDWQERRGGMVAEMPLYSQEGYDGRTSLIRLARGGRVPHHDHPFGEEVLILEGSLGDAFGRYGPLTWIRSPVGSAYEPYSETGCTFLLKTGSVR